MDRLHTRDVTAAAKGLCTPFQLFGCVANSRDGKSTSNASVSMRSSNTCIIFTTVTDEIESNAMSLKRVREGKIVRRD